MLQSAWSISCGICVNLAGKLTVETRAGALVLLSLSTFSMLCLENAGLHGLSQFAFFCFDKSPEFSFLLAVLTQVLDFRTALCNSSYLLTIYHSLLCSQLSDTCLFI